MTTTNFGGGMMPHGERGEADVVDERRAFLARAERPEHFCGGCTAYRGAGVAPCRTCGADR